MLKIFFGKTLLFLSRVTGRVSRILSKMAMRIASPVNQSQNVINSTRYDMVLSDDEPYYASQYWYIIEPYLINCPNNGKILDLGCSQGRFAMKLANKFPRASVTACDISACAIDQAKNYAGKSGITNIEFLVQDISSCIDDFNKDSLDLVFMTEVSIFYPGWVGDLSKIYNTLKPNGLFIISNRSQYFNSLCIVRSNKFDKIDMLLNCREGKIFESEMNFTWQTSEEVSLILAKHKFEIVEQRGIGVCSGITGDPHDLICRPSLINDYHKNELMKLELELGASSPDAGRYILTVAKKGN